MASQFSSYTAASKFVRDRLGVSRLTPAQAAEVRAAVKKNNDRAVRHLRSVVSSQPPAVRLRERIRLDVEKRVKRLVLDLYRTSESKWAGGENDVRVTIGREPLASGRSSRAWSRNGKWSGTNAYFSVQVMPGWKKEVWSVPDLPAAGGMLTTHAERISEDCWRASWVRQGRGFELNVESGFIVQIGDEFFHGKTEASARAVFKRRQAVEDLEREKNSIAAYLRELSVNQLRSEYGHLVISRDDSLTAGNCSSGTDNWIERYFPDRSQATILEVLEVDVSEVVIRAVRTAILRQMKAKKRELVAS